MKAMVKSIILLLLCSIMLGSCITQTSRPSETITQNTATNASVTTNTPTTTKAPSTTAPATEPPVTEPPVTECVHNWSAWETEIEPSCKEEGSSKRTCYACKESETKSISMIDHEIGDWVYEETQKHRSCVMCKGETETKYYTYDKATEYRLDSEGYYIDKIRLYSSRDNKYVYSNAILTPAGKPSFVFSDLDEIVLFESGYAITKTKNMYIQPEADYIYEVVDRNGNIIVSTKDLDVSGLGLANKKDNALRFFREGFLFVYTQKESFNGTKYEVGIYNYDNGSWVVPLSENNPVISSGYACNVYEFESGISYAGENCLIIDISGPQYTHDQCIYNFSLNKVFYYDSEASSDWRVSYLIPELSFSNGVCYKMYDAYFYEFHTDGTLKKEKAITNNFIGAQSNFGFFKNNDDIIYMLLDSKLVTSTGNIVRNFESENINIANACHVGEGNWLVLIKNDQGSIYYSIIDITGSFLFEPEKTNAVYVSFNGYGISKNKYDNDPSGLHITIDINGKVQ